MTMWRQQRSIKRDSNDWRLWCIVTDCQRISVVNLLKVDLCERWLLERMSANLDTSCEVKSHLSRYLERMWRGYIDWWVRTNSSEGEVVSYPPHHKVRVVTIFLNECFIASSRLREDIGRRWLSFYERCRWNSVSNSGVSSRVKYLLRVLLAFCFF